MTRRPRAVEAPTSPAALTPVAVLLTVAVLATIVSGCATARLERPETPATRMIDPVIVVGDGDPVPDLPDAVVVRLLGVRSSDQISYSVQHRTAAGELREDPVWSWSAKPHTYLETALYQAAAADPGIRFADSGDAFALRAIFLSCYLEESGGGLRLLASVELRVTNPDRTVSSQVLTTEEAVSGELPGNMAEAMGRVIRHLATDALAVVAG